jgi:hypothetical protein
MNVRLQRWMGHHSPAFTLETWASARRRRRGRLSTCASSCERAPVQRAHEHGPPTTAIGPRRCARGPPPARETSAATQLRARGSGRNLFRSGVRAQGDNARRPIGGGVARARRRSPPPLTVPRQVESAGGQPLHRAGSGVADGSTSRSDSARLASVNASRGFDRRSPGVRHGDEAGDPDGVQDEDGK